MRYIASGEGLQYFCDSQILLLLAKGNALDLIDICLSMHENSWSTGRQADYLDLSPTFWPPPVFDCYQYASTEKRGWGDLVTCSDVTSGGQACYNHKLCV